MLDPRGFVERGTEGQVRGAEPFSPVRQEVEGGCGEGCGDCGILGSFTAEGVLGSKRGS